MAKDKKNTNKDENATKNSTGEKKNKPIEVYYVKGVLQAPFNDNEKAMNELLKKLSELTYESELGKHEGLFRDRAGKASWIKEERRIISIAPNGNGRSDKGRLYAHYDRETGRLYIVEYLSDHIQMKNKMNELINNGVPDGWKKAIDVHQKALNENREPPIKPFTTYDPKVKTIVEMAEKQGVDQVWEFESAREAAIRDLFGGAESPEDFKDLLNGYLDSERPLSPKKERELFLKYIDERYQRELEEIDELESEARREGVELDLSKDRANAEKTKELRQIVVDVFAKKYGIKPVESEVDHTPQNQGETDSSTGRNQHSGSRVKVKNIAKMGVLTLGGTVVMGLTADQILGNKNSTLATAVIPVAPFLEEGVVTLADKALTRASPKTAQATVKGAVKAGAKTTKTVKMALKSAQMLAKEAVNAGGVTTMLMAAVDPKGTREFIDDMVHLRVTKLGTESLEGAQTLLHDPWAVADAIGNNVALTISNHYAGTEGVEDALARTGLALGQGMLNIGDTVWGASASVADVRSACYNWTFEKLGLDVRFARDVVTYEAYKRDPLKFVGILIVPTTVNAKTGLRSDDDLLSIVDRGDSKALEAYIKKGKEDVNRPFKGRYNEDYIPHESALAMAADKGKMEVAKLLYEQKGVNLNAVNTATGDTTLMCLLNGIAPDPFESEYKRGRPDLSIYQPEEKNNIIIAQAMIDDMLHNKNIDIEAVNKIGENAYLVAAKTGNLAAVARLAEMGTDLNKQSANGSNALHLSFHNQQMTMNLLKMGVDANHVNKKGETPLMASLVSGDKNLVSTSMLLMHANEKGIEQLKKSPHCLRALDAMLKENPEALGAIMLAENHALQAFIKERYATEFAKIKQPNEQDKTQSMFEGEDNGTANLIDEVQPVFEEVEENQDTSFNVTDGVMVVVAQKKDGQAQEQTQEKTQPHAQPQADQHLANNGSEVKENDQNDIIERQKTAERV